MIIQLAHVCFTVSDLGRALEFYTTRLGMQEAFEFRDKQGDKFGAYLHSGRNSFIELFEGPCEASEGKGSYRHLCLQVDDINSTVETFRARGVEVSDPKLGTDRSWQAWIEDPDGNRIEIHQYTPESLQVKFAAQGTKLAENAGHWDE